MAQSYTGSDFGTIYEPGTYVAPKVIAGQGGIATAGVVTIIGEADEGPDFTLESDLNSNSFAPDQLSAVLAKYGSGRIVDAFRALVSANADPAIVGALSLVKAVKTNPSVKASTTLTRSGFGDYASLLANRAGLPGTKIKYTVLPSAYEVGPETSSFAYTPHYSATAVEFYERVNGGTRNTIAVAARLSGPDFAVACEYVSQGILASGCVEVLPLTGLNAGGKKIALAITANPEEVVLTVDAAVSGLSVGMTVVIPLTGEFGKTGNSVICGTGTPKGNSGSYIITSLTVGSSSSSITMIRKNLPTSAALNSVSAISIAADEKDIIAYSNIVLSNVAGQNRGATSGLAGSTVMTVSTPVSGTSLITLASPWTAQPAVGDIILVSGAFGTTVLTAGIYRVTASSSSTANITRLSNADSTWAGGATTVAGGTMTVNKSVIDGVSKSLEIADVSASYGYISSIAFDPTTLVAADVRNVFLTSSSEYKVAFTASKDSTSQTYTAGGDIVLEVGTDNQVATLVIGATQADFKISGVTQFSVVYSQFATLQDFAAYITSRTGYYASVPTSKFNFLSPTVLDRGTYGISSSLTESPARLKQDAYVFTTAVNGSSLLGATEVEYSGLPDQVSPALFLTGGSKGSSSAAAFSAAIDACEAVDTNMMVALVSADASVDIATGDTESSSSYFVDTVNASLKSHVLAQSTAIERKNRLALCARSGTYADQKEAAGNLASYRVALAFEDVKLVNSSGVLEQFQPWATACVAAGMQAAAGYKGIVKKFANVFGIVKPEGDWNSAKQGDRVDALRAGLMPIEHVPTGGYRWVSDQMTYSADNNFVYNSLQAVYVTDLMILDMIDQFDRAIVGQSVADVSASAGLSFLDSLMFNYKRLKWIASSDDAPRGYKNAVVQINGGVMSISLEVKLAGLIYFIPISFSISQVEQTAAQ